MPDADQRPAVVGQVERPVRPRAWEYVDRKGWVQALFAADPHDLYPCKPLYDQAALDAAVAAERERWESVVFDGWRVLKGLDEAAAKRTTYQNVSDTLDALMRVLRA